MDLILFLKWILFYFLKWDCYSIVLFISLFFLKKVLLTDYCNNNCSIY